MSYVGKNYRRAPGSRGIMTDTIIALTPGRKIRIGSLELSTGATIYGNVIGDTTGVHIGSVIGDTTGVHTGSVIGDVTGTLTGSVTGALSITTVDLTVTNEASINALGSDIDANGYTLTGLTASPANDGDAASKAYVDAVSTGNTWKEVALVATTADLNATYVGTPTFTLTCDAVGALVIDGTTMAPGDRVLVKNQTTATENGIYTVTDIGSGATQWVMTRAADYDSDAEISGGDSVFVTLGLVNNSNAYVMINNAFATLDTDNIEWTVTFSTRTPLTTKGDLLSYSTTQTRLPIGANDTIIMADSAEATGIKWATQASIDHGSLGGLSDDDHPQYALLTGRVGDVLAIDDLVPQSANGVTVTATTTPQFTVAYDGSNYATFTSSSGGQLAIAPTGDRVTLEDKAIELEGAVSFIAAASGYSNTSKSVADFLSWTTATADNFNARGSGAAVIPRVVLARSQGTPTAPTAVQTGDGLGNIIWNSYSGSDWLPGFYIRAEAAENWSGTQRGTSVDFLTVKNGSTNTVSRLSIDNAGDVSVNNTTDSSSTTTGALTTSGGLGVAKKMYLGTGLYLPTSGGTPSQLDFYEDGASVTLTTHGFSVLNIPVTLKFSRIGKIVTMYIDPDGNPEGYAEGGESGGGYLDGIPARFQPAEPCMFMGTGLINMDFAIYTIQVVEAGVFFYRSPGLLSLPTGTHSLPITYISYMAA